MNPVRRVHDRHQHSVPLLVLVSLLVVAYVWTDWMDRYPIPGVTTLADSTLDPAFDHGHLSNYVWIHHGTNDLSNQDETLILLLLAGIGFLASYYLPIPLKRRSLVLVTFAGIAWVMGGEVLALLLAAHLLCFATFHRPAPGRPATLLGLTLLAVCVWYPWVGDGWVGWTLPALGLAVSLPLLYVGHTYLYEPLLAGRGGAWLQPLVTHSSLISVLLLTIWNHDAGDSNLKLPMGLLLFFYQWERLFMYRIDLEDRKVPPDLSLWEYLATFFSPAALAHFPWMTRIPLGYAYLNDSFLARDKNLIVLSGLKLIGLAVAFFALGPMGLELLSSGFQMLGTDPVGTYDGLLAAPAMGYTPGVGTVWSVLLLEFLRFYYVWAAVAHLKVGLWRLFGYDIEPYFQKPFLSTNLVELWRRYSYYYRAFLVQAFYFPVFLRFFKRRPLPRIFFATLVAACFGNFLYHMLFELLTWGSKPDVLVSQLRTLPYYLVLGAAIAATQVWLMRHGRRPRRAWTLDRRIVLDVLAVAGTVGFFIWIRPLHHVPAENTFLDGLRICLSAVGIQI